MLELTIHALAIVLVPMFLIGMVGSLIVVAIQFVGDIHEFLSKDDEPGATSETL